MTEDLTTLVLQVRSDQVGKAKDALKSLTNEAKQTETATGGLMDKWKAFTGLLAGAVGIGTAIAGLKKLLDTAKQFESLEAQLKTATGSAENAAVAFQAIQDFAAQTPYDLSQSTEAFIKLVNLGLTPSERALRSYGDTASAMGKDLSTMVQAVANATTGEFEILKQFGVKARTEADGISFSFRGTTTKVKNDAKSIEDYFIALGEKNFGGAMADRMATLEGKLSNLGDAWDVLFATISKAGAGGLMKEAIDIAISAVSELTDMIASGQLAGYTEALLFKFKSLTDGVYNAFNNISDLLGMVFEYWTTDGKGAVDFLIGAFKNFPENVRMLMRAVGVSIGTIVNYADAAWSGAYDVVLGYFNALIKTAVNVGKEIWSHLSPTAKDFDFIGEQSKVVLEFRDTAVTAFQKVVSGINNANDAWTEEITASMDARDAAIAGYEARVEASKKLRDQYNLEREARKAAQGDKLEKFGVGNKGQTAEFQKLRENLRTQEQALVESHAKRRQLILDNTTGDLALQEELLARENEIYEENRREMLDRIAPDLEVRNNLVADANAIELEQLQQSYADKQLALEHAYEARLITEEEYHRRSGQLEQRHTMAVGNLIDTSLTATKTKQLSVYAQVLGMAGDIAGQIEDIAQKSGKGAKAAFYAAKAISIAQAIVATELAAIQAAADPTNPTIFGKVAASTAIRALGYASVALIAGTTIAGYEDGGIIPGTSFTGDKVPARVNSGEMVLNYGQQKQLFDLANGKGSAGGGGNFTVIVNNQVGGAEVETQERDTDDGRVLEVTLKQVETRLANGIKGGGTALSKAFESTYNLRRGAA